MIEARSEADVTGPWILQYAPVMGMPVGVGDPGVQEEIPGEDVEGGPVGVIGPNRTSHTVKCQSNRLDRVAAT